MIIRNKILHPSFIEWNWSSHENGDIVPRKEILVQKIWSEFVENQYLFVKILYFKEYKTIYCCKKISDYKKILKNENTPPIIKNFTKKTKEINIFSNNEQNVYAVEISTNATLTTLCEACTLLHNTKNMCLVTLSNNQYFISADYWLMIFSELNNILILTDNILENILKTINLNDRLMWTWGFFDDYEVGVSLFEKKYKHKCD